jgi:hypothetical protein
MTDIVRKECFFKLILLQRVHASFSLFYLLMHILIHKHIRLIVKVALVKHVRVSGQ